MASRPHEEETIRSTRDAEYSLDPILAKYKNVRFFELDADSPVISVLLFRDRIHLKIQSNSLSSLMDFKHVNACV